jgi:hypothetical protein
MFKELFLIWLILLATGNNKELALIMIIIIALVHT